LIFGVSVISWALFLPLRRWFQWAHQRFTGVALYKNNLGNNILAGGGVFTLVVCLYRPFRLAVPLIRHLSGRAIWQVHNELTNLDLDAIKLRAVLSNSGSAGVTSTFSAQEKYETFSVTSKHFDDAVLAVCQAVYSSISMWKAAFRGGLSRRGMYFSARETDTYMGRGCIELAIVTVPV
jgi:hypothetical protein